MTEQPVYVTLDEILQPVDVILSGDFDVTSVETPMPGVPGSSAYEVAVAEGFVGTEEEWLDSLRSGSVIPMAFHVPGAVVDGTLSAEYLVPYPCSITSLQGATNGTVVVQVVVGGTAYGDPVTLDVEQHSNGPFPLPGARFDVGVPVGLQILSATEQAADLSVTISGTTDPLPSGSSSTTDHGGLTGLGDPDHPISAVIGLQAALDGKEDDGTAATVVAVHEAAADPHGQYLTAAEATVAWGAWSTSGDISVASTTVAYPIPFAVDIEQHLIHRDSAHPSRLVVEKSGVYLFVVSAVIDITVSPVGRILDLWVRINGVDLVDSLLPTQLGALQEIVPVEASYSLGLAAGDYVEFLYHGDGTNIRFVSTPAGTNPTRPAAPAVVVSAIGR